MNPEPLANLCRSFEGYWSPAGPGLRGAAISVTRDLHGHRVVFARGYDDMLYVRWQLDVNPISTSTPWTSWRALGGPISSDPVGYYTGFVTGPRDNPTRVSVIARLANQKEYGGRTVDFMDDVTHLDSRPNYNPFLEWQSVPAPPDPIPEMYFSQPTVIQRAPDGRAWAFCHDGGHNSTTPSSTYFSVWTGDSWLPWRPFGTSGDSSWHDRLFGTSKSGSQRIAGNITGCSYGVGTLELFARSADFLMLHNYTANGDAPGDWNSFNGWATSDIHVILNEDPEYVIDVFWRGTDGQVWTRRKVGSRSAWEGQRPLGGMITSNICSAGNANSTWVIFARGLDNNLYELRQTEVNGIWPVNAWRLIGAPPNLTILADPYSPAATPTSGLLLERPEIYVVASDHSVWMIRQRPDETYSQSDWVSLGGKVWTGMKLRVSTVALETGEARYLDEVGRFVDQAERFAADSQGNIEPIASNNGDIRFARADGVIASCAAPGFFPAIPLNGKTWVDGGMRHSVPVGAAIKAGASRVVAIATVPTGLDAVPRILPPASREPPASLEEEIKISIGQDDSLGLITTYSSASMIDVLVRSFAELLIDSTSWNELYPETPWPVPVWVIQQTFKIHEGQTIEPGLIRMNYACGWMRAFDVLIATEDVRQAAIESTDRIIRLRWQSWKTEARFREAYLIATSPYTRRTSTALTPELARLREAAHLAQRWLGESRLLKWDLRVALLARRDAGFLLPPDANIWLARFERFAPQAHWGLGWENRIRFSEFLFEEIQITVAGNYEPGPFGRSEHSVGAAVPPMLDG
jgi:hypothetical protein